jgi:hypothetical protein
LKEFTSEAQKKKTLQQQQILKEQTEKEKQEETANNENTESPETPSSENNAENEENEDLVGLDDEQNQNVNNSMITTNQNQNLQPIADDQVDDQPEPMNTSAKNEFYNIQSPLKNNDYEMANSPAPVQKPQNESPLLDSDFVNLISENIESSQDWKSIAIYLKMDEDTISFIESDTDDIKQQCTKILRLWKVF